MEKVKTEPIKAQAQEAIAVEDVVEAEVVPAEHEEVGGGGEIVHRPTREVLMPLDADQVVSGMEAYQALLPRLLDASDYQDAGGGRRFVKKSGWRKIARAFNLSVTIVKIEIERAPDGSPERATVVARALAPNGTTSDGDGYCSIDEERFKGSKGRQKIENDLRATATTRAKNRAIADLVGMGEVSAEEVEQGSSPALPHGPVVKSGTTLNKQASEGLVTLVGAEQAPVLYDELKAAFGYLPESVAKAICLIERDVDAK